ncbi:hypothetical protein [Salipiger mucosus]|uniref:hypothetical protein n=1 Tax=Salipiger mucosus TaxID=263378 RepID=UPI000361EC14|nr:hypothetical protein [Salipiger mucosus]
MENSTPSPLDYADIRIAEDGAVLICIDFAGLTSKLPVVLRKENGRIRILQDDLPRVDFELRVQSVYDRIHRDNEVMIAQVRESGKIQIFENISIE